MHTYAPMPMMLVSRLQRKLKLRVAEWVTSAMLISWGVELAANPTMFANPFFRGFTWAPQPTWAAAVMLMGFGRISALTVNGSWRISSHFRAALAALSVMIWAAMVAGVWGSGKPTLGVAIYPWLAVADLYAAYRAGRDARQADDEARLSIHPR